MMDAAALAGYVSFSRLVYMMAEEGHLPGILGRLQRSFRTPHISLLLVYVISLDRPVG